MKIAYPNVLRTYCSVLALSSGDNLGMGVVEYGKICEICVPPRSLAPLPAARQVLGHSALLAAGFSTAADVDVGTADDFTLIVVALESHIDPEVRR
jgi:hypothetical protein